MNKQFLINEITNLIEAERLWAEMSDHIYAFGGSLWETKYAKAYSYHQKLVFNLISLYRKIKENNEAEFDLFQDCIYDLSRGEIPSIHIETNEEPLGYEVEYISNAEELLNFLLRSC